MPTGGVEPNSKDTSGMACDSTISLMALDTSFGLSTVYIFAPVPSDKVVMNSMSFSSPAQVYGIGPSRHWERNWSGTLHGFAFRVNMFILASSAFALLMRVSMDVSLSVQVVSGGVHDGMSGQHASSLMPL